MENRKRVLFVLTLPPPVHGSALMSQYIKNSRLINEKFDCDFINLSTSRKIDEIGKNNPIKLWRLFTALVSLLWKLMTKRYSLCYLTTTCHGIGFLKDVPFVLLCKLFVNTIVIHQHNKGMSKDLGKWPYRWLLPLCYNKAKVILLSWRLYHDIERIVPREYVCICPNGIPDVEYDYKERNNKVVHLLFLSNLIESKGVIVLLDSLKILNDKGFSLVCDFVGGETEDINRYRFEKEVNERGLNNTAYYRGPKFGNDKEKYLSDADIFVFPSYYENECFPLVLLEAMQFGLPIVTSDEGGIPDLVEDGVNGLISEKLEVDAFAQNLEKLIIDDKLRKKMGEAGIVKYKNDYTLNCFENRLFNILTKC